MHAFVHDRIFHLGGAEKVLQDLIREKLTSNDVKQTKRNVSNAPENTRTNIQIFTLFSDKQYLTIDDVRIPITIALPRWINTIFVYFSKPFNPGFFQNLEHAIFSEHDISQTKKIWIQKTKRVLNIANALLMSILGWIWKYAHKVLSKIFDYRNLIVFYPLLTALLRNKIRNYDVQTVTISSFAAVKNIVLPGTVNSLASSNSSGPSSVTLYLHSPMQYIRENYDEYCKKMSRWQLIIFRPVAKYLRKRDAKPRHYDYILANSNYTKTCALQYYFNKTQGTEFLHFESSKIQVQYPKLEQEFITTSPSKTPKDYFLYVGRLVRFIRETDLIIKLCNEINIPLIVMGSGPDEAYLKAIARDTITFIGQINDRDEKIEIIKNARGLLNLAKESCGIGTMEALSLGVPIFGFKGGATPEFVNDTNGVLVENKDLEHLITKFQEFLKKESGFKRDKIKERFLKKV